MRKFNLFTVILLAAIFVFSSCKKKDDEETPTPTPSIPKIKYEIQVNTSPIPNDTTKFTYNSAGKLIRVDQTYDTSYSVITYTANLATVNDFDKTGTLQHISLYTLDANGRAVSSIDSSTLSSGGKNTLLKNKNLKNGKGNLSSCTYTYNSDGYLIKQVSTVGTDIQTMDYVITNGNTTALSGNYVSGAATPVPFTGTYVFNTDTTNTIGWENMGVSIFGKSDKNLIKSGLETYTGMYNSRTTDYTYEYDTKKRVTKVMRSSTTVFTFGSSTDTSTKMYVYTN